MLPRQFGGDLSVADATRLSLIRLYTRLPPRSVHSLSQTHTHSSAFSFPPYPSNNSSMSYGGYGASSLSPRVTQLTQLSSSRSLVDSPLSLQTGGGGGGYGGGSYSGASGGYGGGGYGGGGGGYGAS